MAPTRLINFLTLVSFAVFYVSLTPTAANALAVERAHVARNLNYAHAGIAKKKRGNPSKRCKARPSDSTPTPSSTPADTPAYTPAYTPASSSPQPTTSSSSSTSSSYAPASTPASSSGMGPVLIDWSNGEQSSLCNFKSSHTTQSVILFIFVRSFPNLICLACTTGR